MNTGYFETEFLGTIESGIRFLREEENSAEHRDEKYFEEEYSGVLESGIPFFSEEENWVQQMARFWGGKAHLYLPSNNRFLGVTAGNTSSLNRRGRGEIWIANLPEPPKAGPLPIEDPIELEMTDLIRSSPRSLEKFVEGEIPFATESDRELTGAIHKLPYGNPWDATKIAPSRRRVPKITLMVPHGKILFGVQAKMEPQVAFRESYLITLVSVPPSVSISKPALVSDPRKLHEPPSRMRVLEQRVSL